MAVVPFKTVVSEARGGGARETFLARHVNWALLIETPTAAGEEEYRDGFEPTVAWSKDALEQARQGSGEKDWSNLSIAWLEPKSGSKVLTVGRAPAADVLIKYPSVSTLHAVVQESDDDGWLVSDQGSSHGTRVNGEVLTQAVFVPIKSGDVVHLGPDVKATLFSPGDLYDQVMERSGKR